MRIRAMFVHGGDWRAGRDHSGFMNPRENELLHPVLRERMTPRHSVPHMTEGLIDDPPQSRRRILMRLQLSVCPYRLEHLNQVGGTHDFDPEAPDQLNRAGID